MQAKTKKLFQATAFRHLLHRTRQYILALGVRGIKDHHLNDKPTMVLMHTVKGKGVSFVEAMRSNNHNANLSPEETVRALNEIMGYETGITEEDVKAARFPDPMEGGAF